jgi:hypothetical protein
MSAEVMMKASSGPSPAPWRFRGIASGTVVIEHPCKAAPARAVPGRDCATLYQVDQRRAAYLTAISTEQDRKNAIMEQDHSLRGLRLGTRSSNGPMPESRREFSTFD